MFSATAVRLELMTAAGQLTILTRNPPKMTPTKKTMKKMAKIIWLL